MNEFNFPNHETPQNEALIALIKRHVKQKHQNPLLIGADGKQHQLPLTKHALGQLSACEKKLLAWANFPEHVPEDNLGLVFELFSQQLLQTWLNQYPQTGMQIIPAPASLDFLEKEKMQSFGPSADLILGSWRNEADRNALDVYGLINCQLAGKKKITTHLGLQIPIYPFSKQHLQSVHNLETLLYLFGKAADPEPFIRDNLGVINHPDLTRLLKEQANNSFRS